MESGTVKSGLGLTSGSSKMSKSVLYIVGLFLCFPSLVLADDDASYTSYDSIISELRATADERPPTPPVSDGFDWEEVAIHGGIGFATSWASVATPNGAVGSGLMKGVTVNFGTNLFTRKLRAEGAFTSYAQENFDENVKASLKEFELRVMYMNQMNEKTTLRFGLGLAARYLTVDSANSGQWENYQASTPSSVAMIGFERKITPSVAVGPDLSYRSALIAETIDKSAWNASFRLNATF